MILGYCRPSRLDEQPHQQRTALIVEAKCERLYEEVRHTNKNYRPQLRTLLDEAKAGDVVVVYALDRLARTHLIIYDALFKLVSKGVGVRCLTEEFDTTTPHGRSVLHAIKILTELPRRLGREHGLDAHAEGKNRGAAEVTTTNAQVAELDVHLAEGLTPKAAFRRMGIPKTTGYRMLERRKKYDKALKEYEMSVRGD